MGPMPAPVVVARALLNAVADVRSTGLHSNTSGCGTPVGPGAACPPELGCDFMIPVPLRLAVSAAGILLAGTALIGCGGGDDSDVSCSLDNCTVTFDRDPGAEASILGVDVKLAEV